MKRFSPRIMMLTCRLLLFLALSCWIFTSCEQHELSETKVLYGHGDHDDHGDDHDDHGHDDHGHKEHKDEPKDNGHGDKPKDDHGHDDGKHKSGEAPSKEEPRNLGI